MSDLAQQIADRLLTNGFGDKGDCLAIKLGYGPFPKEKDLGGWGRNSIIDQIQPLIDAETTRLREALEFYADPDTYHAISFMGDRPCGAFADDLSEDEFTEEAGYFRPMPGKTAREALAHEEQQNTNKG